MTGKASDIRDIRSRAGLRRWASPERTARRLEVARRFRAGEDSGTIARALGIGKSTVFDDLKRIAPELLAQRRAQWAEEAAQRHGRDAAIRRARRKGHTLKAIAAAVGVTYQRVQRVVRIDPIPEPTTDALPRTDAPIDRPERPCANCGRIFKPTARRRMLCSPCFRGANDQDIE